MYCVYGWWLLSRGVASFQEGVGGGGGGRRVPPPAPLPPNEILCMVAIVIVINRAQSVVAIKIKKRGKMYNLIFNNSVPHSQYVGSFGPYEAAELSGLV